MIASGLSPRLTSWQRVIAACWSVIKCWCCFLSWQVDLLAKLPEVPRFQLAAMSLTGPGKAAMSVSMQFWGTGLGWHVAMVRV
jgi:hypothetical protein